MKFAEKWVVGVDEAGRGPLAGPITLSAFLAPQNLKRKLIKILGGKVKDSKQFSPAKRYVMYREFLRLRKKDKIFFCASHVSNKIIDNRGISKATQMGISKSLAKLHKSYDRRICVKIEDTKIRLDGSLKAPEKYANQKTIVGGDSINIFIACASIVAKVRRDRLMCRLASKYPHYALEIHKGYGTALHYSLLRKHGISPIHRKSFLTKLTDSLK